MSRKSFVHAQNGDHRAKINNENASGAKGSAAALFILLVAVFFDGQGVEGYLLAPSIRAGISRRLVHSEPATRVGSVLNFARNQKIHGSVSNAQRRMSGAVPLQMKSAQEIPVVSEPRVFEEAVDQNFFRRVVLEVDVNGNTLRVETGEIGRLAAGAVTAKQGDSVVYATACADLAPDKEETVEDFVPLSVHYQERSSSAGKTSGGYIKRDSRPSDEEVLVARIIDRTVRPIFPPGFSREVQILAWVLSYSPANNVDSLALLASSAALLASPIPFDTPIAGVAVGMDSEGNFVVNPTREALRGSRLNLFISGTETSIMMIEGEADFLTEEQMTAAIDLGMSVIRQLCRGLKAFAARALEVRGVASMRELVRPVSAGLFEDMLERFGDDMRAAVRTGAATKKAVYTALDDVEKVIKAHYLEGEGAAERPAGFAVDVKTAVKRLAAETMRRMARDEDLRVDGRTTRQVRPIAIRMTPLPNTCVHGSALFTRGETQALATVTLGDKDSRQRLETLDGDESKRFYLQYTFPPSSVGECGRVGAPGRREIGHGNLAERGLRGALPTEAEFPYTIRVESLITESCGSSSMASVCGGCLAMLDAGVPLRKTVAGVAMGLLLPEGMKRGAEGAEDVVGEAVVLTDILGIEDGLGTMDFKVAGDAQGISAFQLDIKCEGLSPALLKRALAQAKEGRVSILYQMLRAKPRTSPELAPSVPKLLTLTVPQSAIGKIIGPGGATIRSLIEGYKLLNIDIAETGAEGVVTISSVSSERNAQAEDKIRFLVQDAAGFSGGSKTMRRGPSGPEPEVGRVYQGCVITGVHPFGCFVELMPGREGLVHVSELDVARVENPEALFQVGGTMDVKVLSLKDNRGKIRLSRRAALQDAALAAATLGVTPPAA